MVFDSLMYFIYVNKKDINKFYNDGITCFIFLFD